MRRKINRLERQLFRLEGASWIGSFVRQWWRRIVERSRGRSYCRNDRVVAFVDGKWGIYAGWLRHRNGTIQTNCINLVAYVCPALEAERKAMWRQLADGMARAMDEKILRDIYEAQNTRPDFLGIVRE